MTLDEANALPLHKKLLLSRHGVTFYQCIMECAGIPEFISNYDRLRGTNLSCKGHPINVLVDEATGRLQTELEAFIEFVWEYVFTRFGGAK